MTMTSKDLIKKSNHTDAKTILLLGSSGFIGKQAVKQLSNKGHILRTPNRNDIDFINPHWEQISHWIEGVDVIINSVGVMSNNTQILKQVHHYAPVALAELAKRFHVKHWVNLSALGANPNHKIAFVASKGRGDDALLSLADDKFKVSIARPSLVFGRGGASCEMFLDLAKLPVLMLPNKGKQRIQPVHVLDVAQGLVTLAINKTPNVAPNSTLNPAGTDSSYGFDSSSGNNAKIIDFTGGEVCTVADYLTMMRTKIHNARPPIIASTPNLMAKTGISLLGLVLPEKYKTMMNKDSLILLNEKSISSNLNFAKLLTRAPLSYPNFSHFL